MSIKPRQFTDAEGNTFYVNMSKKEYRAAKKAAKNGQTYQLQQGQSIFAGKKEDVRARQNKIAANSDYRTSAQNVELGDTSLGLGMGLMGTKKDYKTLQKEYEQQLINLYTQELKDNEITTIEQKRIEQIAKKEAKELVEAHKAADEVLSAVYFTPDQKDEYKQWKKANPNSNQHAVLLKEDDMKRLSQFDDLAGFVTKENGKRVITPENQLELKKAAAEHVGDDNKLGYKERFNQTRIAKGLATNADGSEGKAISHGSARITKNLFKHLGFDHAHDYTETLITAGVATAATGAALGAITTGSLATVAALDGGGGLFIPGVAGKALIPAWLAATLGGAGAVPLAASQIHPKDKTVPTGKLQEPPADVSGEPPADVSGEPPADVSGEPPADVSGEPPADVSGEPAAPKLRGRAVDMGLANRKGGFNEESWKDSIKPDYKENNSGMTIGLKSQFTIADQDNEIEITGEDADAPDTITLKDDTNREDGVYNTHKYRKLTADEFSKKQVDGKPIKLVGKGPFYVLESVTNPKGESIKANTIEVYALKIDSETVDGQEYKNYNLRQEKGMTGYGRSSIDYRKRGS